MVLARQIIDIPFAGGLDESTDRKRVPPPKLLVAENVDFSTGQQARKRGQLLDTGVASPSGAGCLVAALGNKTLIVDGEKAYCSDSGGAATEVGRCPTSVVTKRTLATADPVDGHVSSDVNGSSRLTAWVSDSQRVKWAVSTEATGALVGSGEFTIPFAYGAIGGLKILSLGSGFAIAIYSTWLNPFDVMIYTDLDVALVTVLSGSATVGTFARLEETTGNVDFDACVNNGNCYVATISGYDVKVRKFSDPSTVTTLYSATLAAIPRSICITSHHQNDKAVVAWYGGDGIFYIKTLSSSGSVVNSCSQAIATPADLLVSAVSADPAGDRIDLFSVYLRRAYRWTFVNYAYVGLARMLGCETIHGRPFNVGATQCLPVRLGDVVYLQGVEFANTNPGFLASQPIFAVLAGSGASEGVIPSETGNGIVPLAATAGTIETAAVAAGLPSSAVVCSGGVHINSGLLRYFDGCSISEHGFISSFTSMTFSGSTGTGHTYRYQACYAWTDATGRRHRSATATNPDLYAISRTNAISATNPITVSLYPLKATEKSNVDVEVYRTTDNGSVYYFVGSVAGPGATNKIDVVDRIADATLVGRAQLYTTGGVLDCDPAPSPRCLCEHRRRLWTVSRTAPDTLSYSRFLIASQEGAAGIPVEFSAAFTEKVSADGAAISALGSLDEKLIVFTGNKIYYIIGDGPDDTGGGGMFSAYSLPFDVGALEGSAVGQTPLGLVFQSEKGIFLLDRSLQIQYIGKDVEATAALGTVTSIVAVPNKPQILLAIPDAGKILCFDHQVGQWSVWPAATSADPAPVSMCSDGDGGVYVLDADGTLYQQVAWSAADADGEAPALKVGSGWIHLAGIGTYERLRRIVVTGEWKSAHRLRWELYTDYDDATPVQSGSFDATRATPHGGYQVRIDVVRQKCEAFRIVLWDEMPEVTTEGVTSTVAGESMRLSGLAIEIGVKRGTSKLPSGQISG